MSRDGVLWLKRLDGDGEGTNGHCDRGGWRGMRMGMKYEITLNDY